jgi:hypothetical protein
MVNHMIGALKVLEFRGPQRHVYGLEHLLFVTYRSYLVGLWPLRWSSSKY